MTRPNCPRQVPAPLVVLAVAAMWLAGGCSSPPPKPELGPKEPPPRKVASPQTDFETRQKERAVALGRQGKLAEAALAWEILGVLRPDVAEYHDQWSRTQGQIDSAVAERLQRATQAQRRGDLDAAAQGYLAVLALQPEHAQAADALRAIERERNKRYALGRATRLAPVPRIPGPARPPGVESAAANPAATTDRNDLEHAAMLTIQGDYDDAIQLLEKRLASVRQDDVARSMLADAYFQKAEEIASRDKTEAIAALEKSVRLDPAHPLAAARLRQLKASAPEPAAAPKVVDKPAIRPGKRRDDDRLRG
jgi:tetratricopeptide (TPR) repeat protein